MRTLFLNCSNGVSGDMLISTMLNHMPDNTAFINELQGISLLSGENIVIKNVNSHNIQGKTFEIFCENNLQQRGLNDIIKIINDSILSKYVKTNSIGAFTRLAEVEGRIHGVPCEKVHFHELGAIDTVADIVGCFILLELLGIDEVTHSPINVGKGKIVCSHGELNVPPPAVLELLVGKTVFSRGQEGERATPTGAVLLSAVAKEVSDIPRGKIVSAGYGFGQREFADGNYLNSVILECDGKV